MSFSCEAAMQSFPSKIIKVIYHHVLITIFYKVGLSALLFCIETLTVCHLKMERKTYQIAKLFIYLLICSNVEIFLIICVLSHVPTLHFFSHQVQADFSAFS